MSAAARSLRSSLRYCSRRAPASTRPQPFLAPLAHLRSQTTDSSPPPNASHDATGQDGVSPEDQQALEMLKDSARKRAAQMQKAESDSDGTQGTGGSDFEKITLGRKRVMMGPHSTNHPNQIDPDEWKLTKSLVLDDKHLTGASQAVKDAFSGTEKALGQLQTEMHRSLSTPAVKWKTFWHANEEDTDLITNELNEDIFDEDDISTPAHAKLQETREYRQYARLAAWQLPLLSKLAVPFQPPSLEQPLRFRYTSYMGELHPAESKVVVQFSPQDLGLDDAQQLKLKKLLGPRWNPDTNVAKISCEQYEHQAQNKRYLGDLVNSLIAQAKDTTDTFEDVPLDTRHHKTKYIPKFPAEWRMTEERAQFLADTRQKSLLLDREKADAGTLVDGTERIAAYAAQPVLEAQPVMSRRGGAKLSGPRGSGRKAVRA